MVDIPLEYPVEMDFPRAAALREGLESLDLVDPRRLFENMASVFKSVPKFLHGPCQNALKFARRMLLVGGVKNVVGSFSH